MQKLQLDYAWKWFAYHADQRIKMFNYMLLVFGIAAAGVVNALAKADQIPVWAISGLCFITAFLALLFTLLDGRNRDLVWFGEDVLIHLERSVLFDETATIDGRKAKSVPFGILWRQERDRNEHAGNVKPIEPAKTSRLTFRIGSYLADLWLGKHRVLLPLIGYLLCAGFLIAGLMILLSPPRLTEKGPSAAFQSAPPAFDPSGRWI